MTWSASDDHRIRAWLHDDVPDRAPASILAATVARTSRVDPTTASRRRRVSAGLLLAAAMAVAALAGGAMIIALSRPPTPMPALAEPRFLGDFLWQGGYTLEVAVPPPGAIDAVVAASTAADPVIAPFLGPADPPIFARLRCTEPGLCGPDAMAVHRPPDVGTTDTWSVWIIEYPQEGAYRILSAVDGRMITGWDGDDLQSCSADEIGTEPGCTADALASPPEIPADVRSALAIWGQVFPHVEYVYTTRRSDDGMSWPADGVDPLAVAATLVDAPRTVDAFLGTMACQRDACPEGVVQQPGVERTVVIVAVDDGARWVIVDATTGSVLADDTSPVEP